MSRIDPHVHCRDEEQARKATIASTLELADSQGVDMIFDMPNTERPVIDERRVMERLALVPAGWEDRYRLYVGVTRELDQLTEAVRCYRTIPEVIGLKMFAGRSVGDLTVADSSDQFMVYRFLASLGYKGVLAVHCEKESWLSGFFDPADPISHCRARPKQAEIDSVVSQIQCASDAEFKGILHICHVSCPESIEAIKQGRRLGLQITCGVTPHHLMWDQSTMVGEVGLRRKMNPPLRSPEDVAALRRLVVNGEVTLVETDHAPHTDAEKLCKPYMSGYPSYEIYRECIDGLLPSLGASPVLIEAMTYGNIVKVFADKL